MRCSYTALHPRSMWVCSKRPVFHPPKPKGAKTPFSTGKAAALLAREAYKPVRERERREERQVCEPEGDKGGRTPLADFFNTPCYRVKEKACPQRPAYTNSSNFFRDRAANSLACKPSGRDAGSPLYPIAKADTGS